MKIPPGNNARSEYSDMFGDVDDPCTALLPCTIAEQKVVLLETCLGVMTDHVCICITSCLRTVQLGVCIKNTVGSSGVQARFLCNEVAERFPSVQDWSKWA